MPEKQFSSFPLIVPTLPRLWTTLSVIRGSETRPPLWEGGHAVGNLRFRYPKLREPTFTEFPTECTSAPLVFCTGYFSSRRAVRLMLMRLRGNRTVRPSLRRTYCINKSVYKYVITRASERLRAGGHGDAESISRSLSDILLRRDILGHHETARRTCQVSRRTRDVWYSCYAALEYRVPR